MEITLTPIDPSYRKDSGQWVLHFDDIPLPNGFVIRDNAIVSLPPQQIAGNHKHPRSELFIGLGEGLTIYWLDEQGIRHQERMNPEGKLYRCFIPSLVPHAIVNHGDTAAILLEFANAKQTREDVQRKEVVSHA